MRHYHSKQINDYYCGPAVIQMALRAFGIRITQKEAARCAHTTSKKGTSTTGMVKALRHFKVSVEAKNNQTLPKVRQALDAGKIVIVCFTEMHWNWGHYAIMRDFNKNAVMLIDPAERKGKGPSMNLVEFKKRWKDPLFTRSYRWAAFVGAPIPKNKKK